MDKMINEIAESVANDVLNKMKHSTTSRPSIKPTTRKSTSKSTTHSTHKPTPTKLKASDQGFIKKEFSTLLSKLESVKEAVSSSKASRKTQKTLDKASHSKPKKVKPTATAFTKTQSSMSDSKETPLLSEVVKLLRGLSTSGASAKPTTPSSSTHPSLKKAMDLLKKASASDSIMSEYNSKLQKAVALLKDLKLNGLSKSSKTTKAVSAVIPNTPSKNINNHEDANSKQPKSGLEKAIEILVNIQGRKTANKHNDVEMVTDANNNVQETLNSQINLQSKRPRKDQDSFITTSRGKKDYERLHMNPKLKEGPSSSAIVPVIPEIDAMDSNDVIKSEETSDSKSSTATSSKEDHYQNLIDKVAKEAAEEVEQSFFKHKKKEGHKAKVANILELELGNRPAEEGEGFNAESHGYRSSTFGHPRSKAYSSTSHFIVPTESTENVDSDDLEPDRLSTVRKLKSRHRWPSTTRTLPELKKFDIPQETVGKCFIV